MDAEKRLQFAKKSLKLREKINFKLTLPLSNFLLGEIHADSGDLKRAMEHCRNADTPANKMNLKNLLVFIYLMYSRLSEMNGDGDKSREYAKKGMELAQSPRMSFSISVAAKRVKALIVNGQD